MNCRFLQTRCSDWSDCAGWPSQLLLTQLGRPSSFRRPWRSRVAEDVTSSRDGEGDWLVGTSKLGSGSYSLHREPLDLEALPYLLKFWCPNSLAKAVEFGRPPSTSDLAGPRTHFLGCEMWHVRRGLGV
eukprot:gene22109-biopygen23682